MPAADPPCLAAIPAACTQQPDGALQQDLPSRKEMLQKIAALWHAKVFKAHGHAGSTVGTDNKLCIYMSVKRAEQISKRTVYRMKA